MTLHLPSREISKKKKKKKKKKIKKDRNNNNDIFYSANSVRTALGTLQILT